MMEEWKKKGENRKEIERKGGGREENVGQKERKLRAEYTHGGMTKENRWEGLVKYE